MRRTQSRIWVGGLVVLALLGGLVGWRLTVGRSATVTLLHTPNSGIQPQAVVDAAGTVHLIYFQGDPAHGDIFYVRKPPQATEFSKPLLVNSQPGSAIATGTIRGGQLALGKNNRVHVVWNGSDRASKGVGGSPMLYTRLNEAGDSFEPERNLITWAGGIDGGGSVAADFGGNVYVTWHATPAGRDEAGGAVYLARSSNEGKTFGEEKAISPPAGACGCCSMRAYLDSKGTLYVLYRSADQNVSRDTILLISSDRGATFQSVNLHRWAANTCPMSSYSMMENRAGVFGAWETLQQVYYAPLQSGGAALLQPVAAPGTGSRKYPVIVCNASGQTLFAWVEDAGWEKGGSLAWQVYDQADNPTAEKGQVPGVPVWGLATAYARSDGGFVLIY